MTFYMGGVYSIPQGNSRASWYGFGGTPSVMFDGITDIVGGGGSSMFSSYQPQVVNRMNQSSPLIMNGGYTAIGNSISISTTIQVDEAISNTNNLVRFFVCQEGYHGQTNMVVDMLATEPFTLDTPGQTTVVNRDFVLEAPFNVDDLRIVVMVQNSSTKEILQATLAGADYAGSMVVEINPGGVDAPWRLLGPQGLDLTRSGEINLPLYLTGQYTLTFLDVPVWTMPANNPQTLTLVDGGQITFTGDFTGGPFAAVTAGPIANTGQSQGVSLIDFDNDGDLDVHVANNGSADQLLRNDGNLSYTDVATGLIADTGAGSSSAWADFNLDGNLDLVLGRAGESNLLLTGDGLGGFVPPTAYGFDDIESTSSVSWADFNLDGNLDLYLANNSHANRLLEGSGDLGGGLFFFTTVNAGEAGSEASSNGFNWIDLNGDRHPELYLANGSIGANPNEMLQYSSFGYFDISSAVTANNSNHSFGSTWGDYDNDGDWDLFVSNDGQADRMYRNMGEFYFETVEDPETQNSGRGRGALWADFNNDTFLDLYVVRSGELDRLLLGDGQGNFSFVPVGPEETNGLGNAVACGDLDGDGDVDLFITREGESNVLLNNTLDTGNGFFELTLIGSGNLPDAIGAVVRLTTGSTTQQRRVSAGGGYLSMDSSTMHFGLADAAIIDQVEISWPDGTSQILANLAVNQFMEVTQGAAISDVETGQTLPKVTVLDQAHPNPFNPSTTIGFALAQSGPTSLDIYTVDGRKVKNLVSETLTAGHHNVTWTGKDNAGRSVASGTYFYRLRAADGSQLTGRMALIK
jgi:enediyne biosynthesis protein E4